MLVRIPVVKGRLKVYSKDTDRINILTKLILHSINSQIAINRIPCIVNLPNRLVMENIEELEKREIIIGDYNGNYKLTEVGNRNFNLLNEIEKINKEGVEVLVDSYTKYIFTKDEISQRYTDNKIEIGEDKVVEINRNNYIKQYLSNLDPSNSKEVVLKMLDKLTEEDREGISVEVKIVEEKGGYIMGKVKENIVKKSEKSKLGSEVVVKRTVYKNTYTPMFNSLKGISKNSIEALEILVKNNFGFVSEKGLEVLEKFRKSKESLVYYYDPKTKEVSTERIKSEIKENEIKSRAVIDIENKEENIDKESIEEIQELKDMYEEDISFKVKVEKEFVCEKFAIEDVIDIYEEVKNV